jgi:hypothetical protein
LRPEYPPRNFSGLVAPASRSNEAAVYGAIRAFLRVRGVSGTEALSVRQERSPALSAGDLEGASH